ncbi:MAG: sensor histidine kinase, partial [Saccharothrix sp.]|nr:sensor histidine kinase [Saccharothrix sp.]
MHEFLRSAWDEPRPPDPPARPRWDWAFIGVLAAVAVVEAVSRWEDLRSPVLSAVIAVGLLPTLRWRRTRPLLVVAIAFGVAGVVPVVIGQEPELDTMVYLLLLPFSLFRWGSGREAVLGGLIMTAKLVSSVALGATSVADGFAGLAILTTAASLGAALRLRVKGRLRELDRVKLLERERL